MRISFPAKIALFTSLIAGIGIMGIAYTSYRNADILLQNQALKHLEAEVQQGKVRIETIFKILEEDVLFLAESPSVNGIMRAVAGGGYDDQENATDNIWRQRLSVIFQTVLKQRKAYLSLRLIRKTGNGCEYVRVDRVGDQIITVAEKNLQVKGSREYYLKAMAVTRNHLYISEVNLSRKNNIISWPITPVIRVATPIFASDGTVFGIIVINADFNKIGKPLYSPPPDITYFLTNTSGDYLIHPNPDKRFAFEFNRQNRLQQDYALDGFIEDREVEVDTLQLRTAKGGIVLEKFYFDASDPQRFMVFGAEASYHFLELDSQALLNKLLVLVMFGIFALCLITVLLVSFLTRPIKELTNIANLIASGEPVEDFPKRGNDEVGDLAISLEIMYEHLNDRAEKIRRSNRELQKEIEERKRSEAALLENNEMWNAIADGSSDAIYVKDLDGRYLIINEAGAKSVGRPMTEIIGKKNSDLISPETTKQVAEIEQEMLTTGQSVTAEISHKMDGSEHVFLSNKGVYRDRSGKIKGIFGVSHDITNLVEGRRKLEQAKAAAESANLAKGQFLANMSHEIRTPMNAIIGMTGLTLDTELTDEQRGYLQTVQDAGSSLMGLLNDILDFSKVEANQLDLEEHPFDLLESIEQMTRILAPKAHAKGIELLVDLPATVPCALLGDQMRLRQIIFNLVGNSIKFTTQGHVCISCRVESLIEDDLLLHFRVQDTGVGIAPEKQAAIFDRFTQVDNSVARLHGGSGLGLAISQKLTQLMGGKIWLESTLGVGTTFHFTAGFKQEAIPLTEDQRPSPEPVSASTPALLVGDHKNNKIDLNILLVDDNNFNLVLAQTILEKEGQKVSSASNGIEALNLLSSKDFDLVFMDVQMPEMDGIKATKLIRQCEQGECEVGEYHDLLCQVSLRLKGKHLPIIAMTAHAMAGDKEQCIGAGMDDYLTKPFQPEDVLNTIRDYYV